MPIDRDPAVKSEILIIQLREIKAAMEAQPHLKVILKQIQPISCKQFGGKDATVKNKQGLVCYGENQDSVDALFSDEKVAAFLTNPELVPYIKTIHLTD